MKKTMASPSNRREWELKISCDNILQVLTQQKGMPFDSNKKGKVTRMYESRHTNRTQVAWSIADSWRASKEKTYDEFYKTQEPHRQRLLDTMNFPKWYLRYYFGMKPQQRAIYDVLLYSERLFDQAEQLFVMMELLKALEIETVSKEEPTNE